MSRRLIFKSIHTGLTLHLPSANCQWAGENPCLPACAFAAISAVHASETA